MSDNFYIPPDCIHNRQFQVSGEQARHIAAVLRYKAGDTLAVFDGQGHRYKAVLGAVTSREVKGELVAELPDNNECRIAITLACALLKKDRFEWLLEKAVELGANTIIPVLTERTIVKVDKKNKGHKLARWNKIALEAAQQSLRSVLPMVQEPLELGPVLRKALDHSLALVPCMTEKGNAIRSLEKELTTVRSVLILIGPEGGFTPGEVEQAITAMARPVTLGRRRLRSETAALAALQAVREAARDF